MYGDEEPAKPNCGNCGQRLVCAGCDNIQPTAKNLYQSSGPWQIVTPLDRVEDVESVETDSLRIMIFVKTKQSGDHVWTYWQSDKVDAWRPTQVSYGKPELRFIAGAYRDSTMMVIATKDTIYSPSFESASIIAQAVQKKGAGWHVTHHDNAGRTSITIECPSKTKARTELNRLGREYAKRLGVKYHIPEGTQ